MKRKLTKILLTSFFCSVAVAANAFDYVSREAGFSVTIPEQNIMVVGENIFAAENRTFDTDKQVVKTNGIHIVTCLTADQLQRNFGKNFTTDVFNSDLNNIQKDSKVRQDVLTEDDYKYLLQSATGAYVNCSSRSDDFSELAKLNEQLSKIAEINKIIVENINGNKALKVESKLKNIGFSLKLPVQQSEIISHSEQDKKFTPITEQGMKLDFAADGYLVMQFDNLYSIQEITYLLSANNNLYAVTSLYPQIENLPEMEKLYKLDYKGFVKLNKTLVQNLKFTDTQQKIFLQIDDKVAGRQLSLPPQWLYTQTDLASMYNMKDKGVELTAYNALPETSLQAANETMQTLGLSFDAEEKTLKMDLSQFTMHDLLNFVDEGVFMISGNLNSLAQLNPDLISYTEEYKNMFNMPYLTKFMFNETMAHLQNIITPAKAAAIEKYLKAENFAYTFDINHYNGRFTCDADLKVHFPDIFKLFRDEELLLRTNTDFTATKEENRLSAERLVSSIMNEDLIPFDCYVKNQLYFNRSRHFNNLLYFTKGNKETANKQILQQFDQSDLYIY